MSKRVMLIILGGILAIVAGIFLMKHELTIEDPDEDYSEDDSEDDSEDNPEVDSGQSENPEIIPEVVPEIKGPKVGYYFDKYKGSWVKCKPKPVDTAMKEGEPDPAVYQDPAPLNIAPDENK